MTPTAHLRAGDAACSLANNGAIAATALQTLTQPLAPFRDQFLDPWRAARGEASKSLLEAIQQTIDAHETSNALRTRARRPDDLARWLEMVEAVVCALALAVINPPRTGCLVVPLSHARNTPPRYRRPTQGEALGRLLGYLHLLGLAHVVVGSKALEATTIASTPKFADLVHSHGIGASDFGRRAYREILLLRHSERRGGTRVKRLVGYEDTAQTEALRAEVAVINETLGAADLGYAGNEWVDLSNRAMRRHFTVLGDQATRFDQGGRLFGGFWQSMRKRDRRQLSIGGESVREVDYSAAFTHIAFAELGVATPRVEDLYAIPGLEGLRRDQIKGAFNMLYFDKGKGRTRWPTDFGELEWVDPHTGEVFEGIPKEFTPARVRRAIVAHYPALADVVGTGIGHHLMFLESQVLLRVMAKAHALGVVVLPIHDAVVVAASSSPVVETLMGEASMEVLGQCIPTRTT